MGNIMKKVISLGMRKLFMVAALMGLLGAGTFGGYYFGKHQTLDEIQDFPFLVTIYTKEYLFLLELIEKQKVDKATEFLFIRLLGNLRIANDYDRIAIGPKLSEDNRKELCDLTTRLENLGKSELIASVPDASLTHYFQTESNVLAKSCNHVSRTP